MRDTGLPIKGNANACGLPRLGIVELAYEKLNHWYNKHGIISIIPIAFTRLFHRVFCNGEVMFVADLNELTDIDYMPPSSITVERYDRENDIPENDKNRLEQLKGGSKILHHFLDCFFQRGAIFWLAKLNGEIAGYHWSLVGGFDGGYGFPMTSKDAVLLSSEVFSEFRGKGVNPAMIQSILNHLKKTGLSRAIISCKVWNTANLRSIPKTPFKRLATFREIKLGKRHLIVWHKTEK
jgi:hypothetical protein